MGYEGEIRSPLWVQHNGDQTTQTKGVTDIVREFRQPRTQLQGKSSSVFESASPILALFPLVLFRIFIQNFLRQAVVRKENLQRLGVVAFMRKLA